MHQCLMKSDKPRYDADTFESQLESGEFLAVTTISDGPSCYQFTYANSTLRQLNHNLTIIKQAADRHQNAANVTGRPT